jgi:hypothetical protein
MFLGAMRLRQLGTTQSIAFVAPPEVYRSIRDLQPWRKELGGVRSPDVVHWLLEQSCKANEHLMSLHIAQGADFCRRTDALWRYEVGLQHLEPHERRNLLNVVLQKEEQTLERLYGPRSAEGFAKSFVTPNTLFSKLGSVIDSLNDKRLAISAASQTIGSSLFCEVGQEQEREVEFEVEQVRELQRPVKLRACEFPGLDPEVRHFVDSGMVRAGSMVRSMFQYLSKLKVVEKYNVSGNTWRLFVSPQFEKTVEMDGSRTERGLTVSKPGSPWGIIPWPMSLILRVLTSSIASRGMDTVVQFLSNSPRRHSRGSRAPNDETKKSTYTENLAS